MIWNYFLQNNVAGDKKLLWMKTWTRVKQHTPSPSEHDYNKTLSNKFYGRFTQISYWIQIFAKILNSVILSDRSRKSPKIPLLDLPIPLSIKCISIKQITYFLHSSGNSRLMKLLLCNPSYRPGVVAFVRTTVNSDTLYYIGLVNVGK